MGRDHLFLPPSASDRTPWWLGSEQSFGLFHEELPLYVVKALLGELV